MRLLKHQDLTKKLLEDIAVLTGGTVIVEEAGMTLEAANLQHCGSAKRVVIDKDNTTIVGGSGKKAEISSRINQIKAQIQMHLASMTEKASGKIS